MEQTPQDPQSLLDAAQVDGAGLDDWRRITGTLHATFVTDDYADGVGLVNAIASLAQVHDHHPELELGYSTVRVRLRSHDVGGLTSRDLRMARLISAAAAAAGVRPEPDTVTVVDLGLDSGIGAQLAPAYAALTGGKLADDEVEATHWGAPTIWFQEPHDAYVPEPGEPAQRWHLDVWVPAGQGEQRVAEFVAAGGRLVSDADAPAFWVVADAEGNRSCVCTPASRE